MTFQDVDHRWRFSTGSLPERGKLARFREEFGRKSVRLEFAPLSDPFHADITARTFGSVGIIWADNSLLRAERTRELIADGNDSLVFQVPAGECHAIQCGREVTLAPGEAALASASDVGTFTCTSAGGRTLLLSLARETLRPLIADFDASLLRRVPATTDALRLLMGYIGIFERGPASTPELERLAITHVYDLVSVALGATRDATEQARGRGLRAARLRAVKADILAHLGDHDLSVGAAAARQGISPVYVRKLFDGEGLSFSEFVLENRLVLARRLLVDQRNAGRAIGAISLDAGFADLSYFNRTFRTRFGATPSDIRAGGPACERKTTA